MPRTVTATTQTEIGKDVTTPIYLVELGFSVTQRYSTRGTVPWNSLSWAQAHLRVNGPNLQSGGVLTGDLTFFNSSDVFAIVFNEDIVDKSCKIWKLYGPGPYAVDDAEQIFDGVMDGVDVNNRDIRIGFGSQGTNVQFAPSIFAEELANHLPAAGRKIKWGGSEFTLEVRR